MAVRGEVVRRKLLEIAEPVRRRRSWLPLRPWAAWATSRQPEARQGEGGDPGVEGLDRGFRGAHEPAPPGGGEQADLVEGALAGPDGRQGLAPERQQHQGGGQAERPRRPERAEGRQGAAQVATARGRGRQEPQVHGCDPAQREDEEPTGHAGASRPRRRRARASNATGARAARAARSEAATGASRRRAWARPRGARPGRGWPPGSPRRGATASPAARERRRLGAQRGRDRPPRQRPRGAPGASGSVRVRAAPGTRRAGEPGGGPPPRAGALPGSTRGGARWRPGRPGRARRPVPTRCGPWRPPDCWHRA